MNQQKNNTGLQKIVDKYGSSRENLLQILIETQKLSTTNHLDDECISRIAQMLNIHESEVYEVATFYSMLSVSPRGKYVIEVCKSAPCHVGRSHEIVEILKGLLGVEIGTTTEDGMFTLQYTNCVGACDIGPVIKIGDKVFGNLSKDRIESIIESYRRGENGKNN